MDYNFLAFRQCAGRLYNKLFEPLQQKYGLNQMEINILLFLYNNPQYDCASDIVKVRRLTKSHVSSSVGSLCARDLLNKSISSTDRKTIHLILSNKAIKIASEGREIQKRFFKKLFCGISEKEVMLFIGTTEKILLNINRELEGEKHNV